MESSRPGSSGGFPGRIWNPGSRICPIGPDFDHGSSFRPTHEPSSISLAQAGSFGVDHQYGMFPLEALSAGDDPSGLGDLVPGAAAGVTLWGRREHEAPADSQDEAHLTDVKSGWPATFPARVGAVLPAARAAVLDRSADRSSRGRRGCRCFRGWAGAGRGGLPSPPVCASPPTRMRALAGTERLGDAECGHPWSGRGSACPPEDDRAGGPPLRARTGWLATELLHMVDVRHLVVRVGRGLPKNRLPPAA